MLWPPRNGWKKPPRWLVRYAEARGIEPAEVMLSYVRPEHVGIKVAWKDLSRGVAAAVMPDVVHIAGNPFPLVPNQTLYSLDAASLDEAYGLAAILNSTIADAILLCIVERAKDAHFRYFGRTVAMLPIASAAVRAASWEALVRESRRAHIGSDVAAATAEIDALVAAMYGVTREELGVLARFVKERLGR
jgi:hypothetical protein